MLIIFMASALVMVLGHSGQCHFNDDGDLICPPGYWDHHHKK